jgi:hypothetical protein
MRTRFTLGAVATTAALAVMPAGAVLAQQSAGSPARAAVASPAALGASALISPAGLHLVSGVVRDLSGHPLGGACVIAAAADGLPQVARTSASGRYMMSLRHTGAYSARYRYCQPGKAAVPVFAPELARRIEVPRAGRIIWQHAGAGPAARAPGASGPPSAAGLTGRATNQAGKPLGGICVFVVSKVFADGSEFALGMPTTRSGTYTVVKGELPAGSYQVLFTSTCAADTDPFLPLAPGPWAPEWYKAKFARSAATMVVLSAHQVTRGINAVMRPAARIGGVVTGSDGRRVANACAVAMASPTREAGQATTNSGGAYTMTGLDPGSYRVLAVPSCGFAPSVYGQAWYPRAQTFRAARAVAARFGHLTSGINIVVPKLGTISGVIRLHGKTGKPLGGICVSADSTTDFTQSGEAVSRGNGTYSIVGLPAGSYQVVAAAAGCGNDGNYAPASYPHPVRAADGKVTGGINLSMQPGGTLSGTVTDAATGKPLRGICVSDDNLDFGLTNAAGIYTIEQLPAERTAVNFSGGCGNKGSYAPQFYHDQVTQEAAQRLTVTAGHVTGGIDAAMQPGATIAGRVTNSAGRPVAGVCITALPPDLAGFGVFAGGDTSTNSSGAYVDANLAPGDYAVAFFSGCLGPSNAAVLQWFKGQPAQESAGLVDARAGSQVTGIDAVVSRGGSIAGTVTSSTGQAVGFSCVTVIDRRTGQPSGVESQTGTDGSFTFSALAPGTYTVVAADCSGGNLAQTAYSRPVTVRAGLTTGSIVIKLPPGGVVTGRITTAGSGRPVPNACVEATKVGQASIGIGNGALTSRSGTYEIAGLRTGSYRIAIFPNCDGSAENLRTLTLPRSVRVTQGKVTARVNASLQPGGSVVGQVSGPGAAAVPGACVEPFQLPGGPVAAVLTGANGRYLLTGLAPGKYKVEFGDPSCSDGAPGLGAQWYNGATGAGSATVITVTAGATVSAINATLPADGTITGSVTDKSASPLPGVCVSAVPLASGQPAIFTVSGGGSYTLDGLPPGEYRVEFQAGCGRSGIRTQWWQDAASSTAAQVIAVSAGATVSGIDAMMTGS